MAIEAKRGCGYRKVGGTYMVAGELNTPCDRLPFKLIVCPCCGEGYRPSRGLRQVSPYLMLGGAHNELDEGPVCKCGSSCYICNPPGDSRQWNQEEKTGYYLEWIGGSFYKTPSDFTLEAVKQGISRRLKGGVPRDLVVGKTIVFLAHREIIFTKRANVGNFTRGIFEKSAGIFSAFIVRNLEHICTQSEYNYVDRVGLDYDGRNTRVKQLINLINRGVKLIPVPDNDPDHK